MIGSPMAVASILMLCGAGVLPVVRILYLGRRPAGDPAVLWSRVAERLCVILAPPALATVVLLAILPGTFAASGLHLQADLTGFLGGAPRTAFWYLLLLPWLLWLGVIAVEMRRTAETLPPPLAGVLDESGSRRWVLLLTLPLVPLLVLGLPRLGGSAGAFPAATWSALASLLLSLVGAATAPRGASSSATERTPREPQSSAESALQPWPQAMAARGVATVPIHTWAASPETHWPRSATAIELAERLGAAGAKRLAPELIEAVDRLLRPADWHPEPLPAGIVFAPDDCGQEECVGMAARTLAQRFCETTVIVAPGDPRQLARRIAPHYGPADHIAAMAAGAPAPETAWVWVTDPVTLSESLLPSFSDHRHLRRLGLVVWWGLERYSGAPGAHLWAITRRLYRLLRHHRQEDVRTLALVRTAPHGGAQLEAFVRRLLPHPFRKEDQTWVPSRLPREVRLHLLGSHEAYLERPANRGLAARTRHLSLIAARASVEAGWPTCIDPPPEVSAAEARELFAQAAGNTILQEALLERRTDAGAWIGSIPDTDLLALLEIIGQGGRSRLQGEVHHAALVPPTNPYARHLLRRLSEGCSEGRFEHSRRMICAEGQRSILTRHLLLALGEVPATRTDLLRDFLWEGTVIQETLDHLGREGKLATNEVRFLDEGGQLHPDPLYHSRQAPERLMRPLDTVGSRLIEVRARDEGHGEEGGVQLRVDPERLTIEAYPQRVFLKDGKRYRVRNWSSVEDVITLGTVDCVREQSLARTFRVRRRYLEDIRPAGPTAGFGSRARPLLRQLVDLTYEEHVLGTLEIRSDPGRGVEEVLSITADRRVRARFATRALLILFQEEQDGLALASTAEALRHLLPVHWGLTESDVEVVPLDPAHREYFRDHPASGLALVDLYPGGIGLLDTVGEDGAPLMELLDAAHRWLASCECRTAEGCTRCVRSLSARAAHPEGWPERTPALRILEAYARP
jgi:hypothetical protein